jgi:hypothetical protein
MAVALFAGQIAGPFASVAAAEAWYATTFAASKGVPVSFATLQPV